MAVNLILGDSTGTPPTGNTVDLYESYSGGNQIGEYPSDIKVPDGLQIKRFDQLDGAGALQAPPNDYRTCIIQWDALDLDVFDVSGAMVYELKARRYHLTGQDYFLGAAGSTGAFFLRNNPTQIRIIDVETELIPNSENRKFANVKMTFQLV